MNWDDPKLFAVDHPSYKLPVVVESDMPPWKWEYEGPPEPPHFNLTCGLIRDIDFKRFGRPWLCVCNDPPLPIYVHPSFFK
jgi:hypothetical protein